MADQAPLVREIKAFVPAQGTAGSAQDQVIGEAPLAGTVTAAKLVPEATLTANGTNYRTFRVINKGQAGSGSTVAADTPRDRRPAR